MLTEKEKLVFVKRLTADDIVRRSDDSQAQFIDNAMAAFHKSEEQAEKMRMWRGLAFALLYTLGLIGIATSIVLWILRHP